MVVSVILKPLPLQKCFEAIYNWSQTLKKSEELSDEDKISQTEGGVSPTIGGKIAIEMGQPMSPNPSNNQININNQNNIIVAQQIKIESTKHLVNANARRSSSSLNRQSSKNERLESHGDEHNQSKESKKPNQVLLNLRRPSKQLTNKMLSGMDKKRNSVKDLIV